MRPETETEKKQREKGQVGDFGKGDGRKMEADGRFLLAN